MQRQVWQPQLIASEGGYGAETGTKLYISNLDYGVSNEDIKVFLLFCVVVLVFLLTTYIAFVKYFIMKIDCNFDFRSSVVFCGFIDLWIDFLKSLHEEG